MAQTMHTLSRRLALLAAGATVLTLVAASCKKIETNGLDNGDALPMTIQPEVVSADGALRSNDGGATKATLINEAAGLRTQGFGLSLYDGTTALKSKVEMEYKSGAWAPKGGTMDWKWPAGRTYSFYAWSPADLPVGTVTSTGVPAFSYSGIADQEDIMLGTYTGTGDNGAAPIKFYHPLASIQFKTGKMTNLKTLNKIELEGVITSGTCTPTMSGSSTTFAWSALGTTTTTLSQTGLSVASTTSGTAIGTPFLTLPQTSQPLTVKITDSDNKVITAAITAPALTAGHTAVYTIDYDGLDVKFSISIKNWGEGQSEAVAIAEHTLPDPEYWVDLGMVSENGYPLYISKRNIARVENGVAYFTDSETESGKLFNDSYSTDVQLLNSIKQTEDGVLCRIMNPEETWSFCNPDNFTKSVIDGVFIMTSKINGNTISFPSGQYCPRIYFGYGQDIHLFHDIDEKGKLSGYLKLVYEDTFASTYLYDNFYMSFVAGASSVEYDDGGFKKYKANTGQTYGGGASTFFQSIKYTNGYTLTYDKVPDIFYWNLTAEDGSPCTNYSLDANSIIGSQANRLPAAKLTVTHKSIPAETDYYKYCIPAPCLAKGTLIALADGSRKPVEELTYDDDLKVWNFDEGRYDSAKLLWITQKGQTTNYYFKTTLSDGTVINTVGPYGHRLCNLSKHLFEYATDIEIGSEVYTDHGIQTVVSCERIDEEVEYYNLITKRHINCFAEGVLAASHFNNVYPIDEDMKFIKDGRKIRPWREFRKAFKDAGIGKDWYEGVRLGEQPDSLDDVVDRLAKKEAIRQPRPEQPGFFARIWNWIKNLFS